MNRTLCEHMKPEELCEKCNALSCKVNPLVRCGNCRHWNPTGEIFKCFGENYRLGWCKQEDEWESTGDCERCDNFDGVKK